MTIAITAAGGRLGRATLKELMPRAARQRLVAVVRDPAGLGLQGVDVRCGDYNDATRMRAALVDVDTVVLISAPVAGGGDRLAMHRNVIDAAVAAGVRKVIYTSVIGNELCLGTYFEPFYRINQDTEQYLQESGLEWIVARNGLYLDLDLFHIRHAAAHDGVYRNNAGEGRCGYISIAELGFALARLAISDDCNGRSLNLFGELCSQAELVAFANAAYGLDVRYEAITLEQNVARFMADERIAARGEDVARMLSGCFQCMEQGAYEVASHFEQATGRPARSIPAQLATLSI